MHLLPRIGLIAALAGLSACGVSQKDYQAAKDDAANGWAHYRNLSEKTEAVDSAVSDLRGQVDRLDSEDWRGVVPDIKSALDQVESDQAEASDASAS